ncbi:hypothetical protein Tco_0924656 [Tanacetum coccineum]|uniref:Uncharacterized protein n=1 Tax=Tanacetum coccineum TaxID=301880 RepID=A0ABQ5D5X0_9ASTR
MPVALPDGTITLLKKRRCFCFHNGFVLRNVLYVPGVGNKSSSRVNTAKDQQVYPEPVFENFDLEVNGLENTQNNAWLKLHAQTSGSRDVGDQRIKYILQIQDYALWEVIENGNSWVPIPVTTPPETGTSTTTKMTVPATIEEKTCKKMMKKVKKSAGASNDDKNLAFVTTSGASSTNIINTVNLKVSTATTKVNTTRQESSIRELEGKSSLMEAILLDMINQRYHQEELYIHKEEMAPMALSDSKVNNDKSCSKTCLTNYEALKKQYDDLLVKLDDTGFKASTYKRGLSILEGQILKYKEHEVLFSEEIALLKRSVGHKEYQMGLLRTELEKVKQEKEGFEFKIAKFEKSAKDLDQLLGSQITDNSKKRLGYSVVPPPHPLILNRPTPLDLSYYGLDEFKGYGHENSKKESNVDEVESPVVVKKKTIIRTAAKIEKPVRKPEMYSCPNQQRRRIVSGNNYNKKDNDYYSKTSHSRAHKHMAPRAVLMKTDLKSVNTARPVNIVRSVNTGRPFNTARPFRSTVNTVKASACWVWMPKNRVVDHVSKNISASVTLRRLDYIDVQGRFNYYCWFKITAVSEKVNAVESLLVVSTEVNAN